MDITQIKSRIVDTGLAKKNRFEVLIPGFAESTFLANECNLPQISINTTPYRQFPPLQQHATDVIYDDLVINFYVDSNYNIRKLLEQWYQEIINLEEGTWSYRDDYMRDIQVNFLDEQDATKLSGNFLSAYPKSIGSIDKSFQAGNEIQTITATFTYSHYNTI